MQVHRSSDVWHSGRPYAPAVSTDGWTFVSGQVPVTADGSTAGPDPAQQVAQVLENVRGNLAAAGGEMSDIVSTQVFLTDISDIDVVDAAYRETFAVGAEPSRTTVEISRLGKPEFRVEISAVAYRAPTPVTGPAG